MRKNLSPVVSMPPPAMLIVHDEETEFNQADLKTKICAHIGLGQERITFCTTKGSKDIVVEQILKTSCNAVMYYGTPTGITELYQTIVRERSGDKEIVQYHVPRKNARNSDRSTHSMISFLKEAATHFNRLFKKVDQHQKEVA